MGLIGDLLNWHNAREEDPPEGEMMLAAFVMPEGYIDYQVCQVYEWGDLVDNDGEEIDWPVSSIDFWAPITLVPDDLMEALPCV